MPEREQAMPEEGNGGPIRSLQGPIGSLCALASAKPQRLDHGGLASLRLEKLANC